MLSARKVEPLSRIASELNSLSQNNSLLPSRDHQKSKTQPVATCSADSEVFHHPHVRVLLPIADCQITPVRRGNSTAPGRLELPQPRDSAMQVHTQQL